MIINVCICRRKAYDQTGSLEDSETLSGEQFESLYEYYRNIYKKVSEDDIDQVEEEYRGSDEEKEDLLKYYKQFKGDMEKVSQYCFCAASRKLNKSAGQTQVLLKLLEER